MKIIATILLSAVLSSCSLLVSQKIPKDVKVEENKYVALALGSEIYKLYKWPNDAYHTQLFNDWWGKARYMGTNSLLPYTFKYRLYFSRESYIEFNDENDIMFVYIGKERDGDPSFFRKAKAREKALLRECIRITKTSSKINNEPFDSHLISSKYWKN